MNDFFRFFAEFGRHRHHAVVKTRAHSHHHIGIMHGQIGFISAVHAEHAEELPVGRRISAQAHQSAGARHAGELHKFGELLRGIAQHHAAAEIHQRALGRSQHLNGFFDLTGVAVDHGLVRTDENIFLRIAEFGHRLGNVFGHINHHRARAAAAGDLKSFFHCVGQLVYAGYEKIVLHARARHADHVDFLKRIAADGRRADLAGNHHHRNRIGVGRGNAGNRIGGAGAGSDQSHAHFAAGACISIGRMHCRLLVAHQDMPEFV